MSDDRSELEEGLKAKHGEVFCAEFEDVGGVKVQVYFRCPTRAESDRFKAKAFDDKNPKKQAEGADELGRCVVVHPPREAFDAFVDRRPMVPAIIAGEANQVASGKGSDLGKRL